MTTNQTDYGKAGRNLPVATAVGLGLLATVMIVVVALLRAWKLRQRGAY